MTSQNDISNIIKTGTSFIDANFKDRQGFGYLLKAALTAFSEGYLFNKNGAYRGKCNDNNIIVIFQDSIVKNKPDAYGFAFEITKPLETMIKKYSFRSPGFIESKDRFTTTFLYPTYLVHTSKEKEGQQIIDILYQETTKRPLIVENPRKFISDN